MSEDPPRDYDNFQYCCGLCPGHEYHAVEKQQIQDRKRAQRENPDLYALTHSHTCNCILPDLPGGRSSSCYRCLLEHDLLTGRKVIVSKNPD